MSYFKLYIFLIITTLSCQSSDNKTRYSEVESILITKTQAEDVSMTIINKSSTLEGLTTYEDYLQVELYKPKLLLDIKFNQRIYKERRDQLVSFLLDSLTYDSNFKFDELRLRIIEKERFLIFRAEKSYTETFKIR